MGSAAPTPVIVFHPGVQHSWQTATALQQLGRLAFYSTSIFYRPDRWPYRVERYLPAWLRDRLHTEFRRFSHPGLDPELVRTGGVEEWLERLAARGGWRRLAGWINEVGNRRFGRSVGRIASSQNAALWGYNDSALEAFRITAAAGRFCILDRTIGAGRPYNRIMAEIAAAYPDYVPPGFDRPVSDRELDREDAEYELADLILAGCDFAADTVREHVGDAPAASRVRVLDYCYDEALFAQVGPPRPTPADRPLRFLFLGQAGPRKGLHLILRAFDRVPRRAATLTVVGNLQIPADAWARHAGRVDYRPTVPRADVPAVMADHDVLLFPSYFEGGGLVLFEALASGMALIQSDRCARAVTAETGLLLPELSEDALHAAMMTAVDNRWRVDEWRRAAQPSAARFNFACYRDNIRSLFAETLDRRVLG